MTQTQPYATESRTFSWTTPGQVDVAALLEMTGLEQLQSMREGGMPHPPIMDTLGITDLRPEQGRVTVEMPAAEFHYNPLGSVHGGVISTLLDTAAACAVHTTLAVGELYTSVDLAVKFLRPVTVDSGLLTCEGTVSLCLASFGENPLPMDSSRLSIDLSPGRTPHSTSGARCRCPAS